MGMRTLTFCDGCTICASGCGDSAAGAFPATRCLVFETAFGCLLLDGPFRNDREVSTMATREAPRFSSPGNVQLSGTPRNVRNLSQRCKADNLHLPRWEVLKVLRLEKEERLDLSLSV
jgi:hypothetical protein